MCKKKEKKECPFCEIKMKKYTFENDKKWWFCNKCARTWRFYKEKE